MSTLQDIRDRVRLQMDLDEDDLPDGVLDPFIREGFDHTFALEQAWPFFETVWELPLTSPATTLAKPATLGAPVSLRNVDSNKRLVHIDQRLAEDSFEGTQAAGEPILFSLWGDTVYLWPHPTAADRNYELRGYRKPAWTGVAGDELDGDDRLHPAVAHYATALAYAQQEDPELEATYMQRWARSADEIRKDLMRPHHHEPLVLNGGLYGRRSGVR